MKYRAVGAKIGDTERRHSAQTDKRRQIKANKKQTAPRRNKTFRNGVFLCAKGRIFLRIHFILKSPIKVCNYEQKKIKAVCYCRNSCRSLSLKLYVTVAKAVCYCRKNFSKPLKIKGLRGVKKFSTISTPSTPSCAEMFCSHFGCAIIGYRKSILADKKEIYT